MKFIDKICRYIVQHGTIRQTRQQIAEQTITSIRMGGGIIGERVAILNCNIDMLNPYLITIGSDVTLTGVRILTHDASMNRELGYTRCGKVRIGNNVFVGKDTVILPDTSIGNNVVIGAGTVVAKDIPDNSVVVGNPCRVISKYDEFITKVKRQIEESPIIDKFPENILSDAEAISKMIHSEYSFMR